MFYDYLKNSERLWTIFILSSATNSSTINRRCGQSNQMDMLTVMHGTRCAALRRAEYATAMSTLNSGITKKISDHLIEGKAISAC